ncbi:MAG TPA: hypothetical protein VFI03_01030 [Solirubrobacterales bacterium]|nr:hypothetical protein [Solirubrobacterales bacterium]
MSLLALAAAAAVAVGCGSNAEGGDSGLSTSSLSKAEYVKKVDEICELGQRQMIAEFSSYARQQGTPDNLVDPKLAPGIVTVLIPAIKAQNEEIENLGAPAGDASEIEAFLNARRKVVARAEKRPPRNIFKFGDEFRYSPNKLATKYGLKACVY